MAFEMGTTLNAVLNLKRERARARQTSLQLDVHPRGRDRERGNGAVSGRPAFSAKNARDIRKQRERGREGGRRAQRQ